MHMLSKKDLNSAEMDTLRRSRILTTVVTAKSECKPKKMHKKMFTISTFS